MDELAGKRCEACGADAPQVTSLQCEALLAQLPQWRLIEVNGVKQLTKIYLLNGFLDAMAQAEKVAQIAQQENHHPALLVEWGRLTVTWWSHKIKGLHQNDFIMAARTERLFML